MISLQTLQTYKYNKRILETIHMHTLKNIDEMGQYF